ncbi:hypothetical protein ACTXT7_006962 [Hymenolepis weldensis]
MCQVIKALKALIFVIDSGDHDRIYEARDAIHEILQSAELRDTRILILANKQICINTSEVDPLPLNKA